MWRALIKSGLATALSRSGMVGAVGRWNGARHRPLILAYHRAVEDFRSAARSSIPAQLVSLRTLERQLDCVGRRYAFLSLDELGARLEAGEDLARPVAAVTFDDGYADVFHHAFPLLQRKGIPFAAFVVTDLVGTRAAPLHDRLYHELSRGTNGPCFGAIVELMREAGIPAARSSTAVRRPMSALELLLTHVPQGRLERALASAGETPPPECAESWRLMDWDMLRQLRRAGAVIGSHTRSHGLLTVEPESSLRAQLVGSRQALERGLGTAVVHFAYPDGRFDAAAVGAVRAAGYRYAYTVCRHRDRGAPLLTIPRRVLWERSSLDALGRFSPSVLSCQVSGLFDFAGDCARGHGAGPCVALRAS